LLSNAGIHEIIDTNIQKERTKENKNKELKDNRVKVLIKRLCICKEISKLIINDTDFIVKIENNKDILEEMTILELKLLREIKEIKKNIGKEVNIVQEDTNTRIKKELQKGTVSTGTIIKEGKLAEKQQEIRDNLSKMNKDQARSLDLCFELIEDLEGQYYEKKKEVGRPKQNKDRSNKYNTKIMDNF